MHFKQTINRSIEIAETPRLMQMQGMFDIPPAATSSQAWEIDFTLPDKWNVGVIVGPSGSGKSTIAGELFGGQLIAGHEWPRDKSILDGFPAKMSIKDITGILSSVGFSSPPAWMRPFHVLSNGQQFRVNLARTLAELVANKPSDRVAPGGVKPKPEVAVVDEYSSVVDRTVAKIGSAAVAKTVRRYGLRFIAVTCHADVIDWLEPDWVFDVQANQLLTNSDGQSRRWVRPDINLKIIRTDHTTWARVFAGHHYLTGELHRSAACFCGLIENKPAVFAAVLFSPHAQKPSWRESRLVCLPDFQGIGLGNLMSKSVASLYAATGTRYISTTSHPALIRHRATSPSWNMLRRPSMVRAHQNAGTVKMQASGSHLRLTAGFEYVGPTNLESARQFGLSTGKLVLENAPK